MRDFEFISRVQGRGQVTMKRDARHLTTMACMVMLLPVRVVSVKVRFVESWRQ